MARVNGCPPPAGISTAGGWVSMGAGLPASRLSARHRYFWRGSDCNPCDGLVSRCRQVVVQRHDLTLPSARPRSHKAGRMLQAVVEGNGHVPGVHLPRAADMSVRERGGEGNRPAMEDQCLTGEVVVPGEGRGEGDVVHGRMVQPGRLIGCDRQVPSLARHSLQPALAASRSVRLTGFNIGPMTTTGRKAHWARKRAASLWEQARQVDASASGDWRSRARSRVGADRLRREAARFEAMAARWDPELQEA